MSIEQTQQYVGFVEMVAHDLQAPLRKLGVLTERLTDKYKSVRDEEVDQYVRRIHATIEQMRSLICDFTELASVTPAGIRPERCDLNEIVKNVLHKFTPLIREKKADVKLSGLPMVEGDRVQLELLFSKLVKNSLTFSREDTAPQITISAGELPEADKPERQQGSNAFYVIRIADNGIGLEQEDEKKIFEPLVRLHGKAEYPGNGLGLTLVKKVAENHGGWAYAEGNENGVTIHVVLPENQS